MVRFANSEACRHQAIASYFDDTVEACGTRCDNCSMPESSKIDITDAARKLLSAIYRTQQRFGLHYVIDVLRGSREQRILENGHDALSVYGIGETYSKAQWLTISDRLLELGAVTIGEFKVYCLTPSGTEILKGSKKVDLKEERLSIRKAVKKKEDFSADYDTERFEKLRLLRSEMAQAQGVPPYIIFSDKTLKDMSVKLPQSKEAMLEVHGIGEVKFERYGEQFLTLLQELSV